MDNLGVHLKHFYLGSVTTVNCAL